MPLSIYIYLSILSIYLSIYIYKYIYIYPSLSILSYPIYPILSISIYIPEPSSHLSCPHAAPIPLPTLLSSH